MLDKYGRDINYLRVSLTEKCNLKCIYCMPNKCSYLGKTKEKLTNNEIVRIVNILAQMGIKKVRFTGGEPLLREDIEGLFELVNNIEGIENIAITTNGILLEEKIECLYKFGLKNVNISLDTLDETLFSQITRGGNLKKVIQGLNKAIDLGVNVKINAVIMKGVNENSIKKLASLTIKNLIDVRFIELMPIGEGKKFIGLNEKDVLQCLNKEFNLLNICDKTLKGPARYKQIKGAKGKLGFISPMTNYFCSECNRLRLTYDGFIKQCINSKSEFDIKKLIYEDADIIKDELTKIIYEKPKEHLFNNKNKESLRYMFQIGG